VAAEAAPAIDPSPHGAGSIAVRDVEFGYARAEQPIMCDLTFDVRGGEFFCCSVRRAAANQPC